MDASEDAEHLMLMLLWCCWYDASKMLMHGLLMQMQVTSVCTGFPAKQKRFLREPVEASGGNSLKYNFLTKLFIWDFSLCHYGNTSQKFWQNLTFKLWNGAWTWYDKSLIGAAGDEAPSHLFPSWLQLAFTTSSHQVQSSNLDAQLGKFLTQQGCH